MCENKFKGYLAYNRGYNQSRKSISRFALPDKMIAIYCLTHRNLTNKNNYFLI